MSVAKNHHSPHSLLTSGRPHSRLVEGGQLRGMMIEDILKRIQDYAPGADIGLVVDAYQYAALCHRGQIRKSGEDYLVHPLAVAHILAELRMDVETIATGLLHDTIEDTLASYEEIEQRFGKAVAEMVAQAHAAIPLKTRQSVGVPVDLSLANDSIAPPAECSAQPDLCLEFDALPPLPETSTSSAVSS